MHLEIRKFYYFLVFTFLVITAGYLFTFGSPRLPLLTAVKPSQSASERVEKFAYATFLGPPTSNDSNGNTSGTKGQFSDPYFTSVRLLNHQIRHVEQTRTTKGIPFLVLHLPNVPTSQTDQLEAEGAVLVPIQPLDLPDAFDKEFINNSRFRDVLSKLRLWQLVEYDKVLYLDADSFLLQNLDTIFMDPDFSAPRRTLLANTTTTQDIAAPPDTYLMAASSDTYGDQTEWEEPGHINYLCACFMLFKPSMELFNHYIQTLVGPDAPPNAAYPEQDLLIYVHRQDGPMPWQRIPVQWSANDGEMNDEYAFFGGVKSLHVKGWDGAEGGNVASQKYRNMWRGYVDEMEKFYEQGERQ